MSRPKLTDEFRQTIQHAFRATPAQTQRIDFVCDYLSKRLGRAISRTNIISDLVMTTVDKICIAHPNAPKPADLDTPRSFVYAAIKGEDVQNGRQIMTGMQTPQPPRPVAIITAPKTAAVKADDYVFLNGKKKVVATGIRAASPPKRKRPPSKSK